MKRTNQESDTNLWICVRDTDVQVEVDGSRVFLSLHATQDSTVDAELTIVEAEKLRDFLIKILG